MSNKKSNPKSSVTRRICGEGLSMRTIDFLGGGFNLTYSTSTGKHQTVLGGYTTVLLGLVVLFSSVFILSEYFNTEVPIVTSSTEYHSNYTEFDLYEEELFSPFAVLAGPSLIPAQAASRYITGQIEIEEYFYNNQTHNYQLRTVHIFKFVPCDILNDRKVLDVTDKINSVASELKGNGLCPDFKTDSAKFKAMRNISNSTYYSPKMSIYPCSLPDRSQCASPEELSLISLVYTSIEKLLISSNFEEPISTVSETDSFEVDLSLRKKRGGGDQTEQVRGRHWDPEWP